MPLNWFQRLFEKEITGQVKRKIYVTVKVPALFPVYRTFPVGYIPGKPASRYNATLYEIEDREGSTHFAGFYGSKNSPLEADEVEMRVSRFIAVESGTRVMNKRLKDGLTKAVEQFVEYGLVNGYKILRRGN